MKKKTSQFPSLQQRQGWNMQNSGMSLALKFSEDQRSDIGFIFLNVKSHQNYLALLFSVLYPVFTDQDTKLN